ncbi:MAG: hypothetical protein WD645_05815 [Dehalococcoidia bacterium]
MTTKKTVKKKKATRKSRPLPAEKTAEKTTERTVYLVNMWEHRIGPHEPVTSVHVMHAATTHGLAGEWLVRNGQRLSRTQARPDFRFSHFEITSGRLDDQHGWMGRPCSQWDRQCQLTDPATFLAICVRYEPFRVGGNLWQIRSYEMKPLAVRDVGSGLDAYLAHNPHGRGYYGHYEVQSGALLGHGLDVEVALNLARENVATTVDLEDQIERSGSPTQYERIDTDETLKLAAKNHDEGR